MIDLEFDWIINGKCVDISLIILNADGWGASSHVTRRFRNVVIKFSSDCSKSSGQIWIRRNNDDDTMGLTFGWFVSLHNADNTISKNCVLKDSNSKGAKRTKLFKIRHRISGGDLGKKSKKKFIRSDAWSFTELGEHSSNAAKIRKAPCCSWYFFFKFCCANMYKGNVGCWEWDVWVLSKICKYSFNVSYPTWRTSVLSYKITLVVALINWVVHNKIEFGECFAKK